METAAHDVQPTSSDPDPTEDLIESEAIEVNQRLWVRAIIPLLQLRSHDSDPSGRVQLAFDLAHIAACEALARILQHVGPREPDGGQ